MAENSTQPCAAAKRGRKKGAGSTLRTVRIARAWREPMSCTLRSIRLSLARLPARCRNWLRSNHSLCSGPRGCAGCSACQAAMRVLSCCMASSSGWGKESSTL